MLFHGKQIINSDGKSRFSFQSKEIKCDPNLDVTQQTDKQCNQQPLKSRG
jgi:hypothetical protein